MSTTQVEESTVSPDLKDGPGVLCEGPERDNGQSWYSKLGQAHGRVMWALENWWERWGEVVATHPRRVILVALTLAAILSLGLVHLQFELRPDRLWLTQTSSFFKVNSWRAEHWARDQNRHQLVVWEAKENLLTADAVRAMMAMHNSVALLKGGSWDHLCARVASPCGTMVPRPCQEMSLLQLWQYDAGVIANLTDRRVVEDVNRAWDDGVGREVLGGVVLDAGGRVVAARAALHVWVIRSRQANITGSSTLDLATGQLVDQEVLPWEKAFVHHVLTPTLLNTYVNAAHSFTEESIATMYGDVPCLVVGLVILFLYLLVTLGRPLLTFVGFFSVVMALAAAFGLCSAVGLPCGPPAFLLPMLLIGLGVDDMYVLAGAWRKTGGSGGLALRAVGMAMTLTSTTDGVSFLIGSGGQLPAFRWFCIYATIGIAFTFLLQVTVFLAALAMAERDREAESPAGPQEEKEIGRAQRAIEWYACALVKRWVATTVVAVAVVMAALGVWGATHLSQETSPKWLLPRSSYLYRWYTAMDRFFPDIGESGTVYFANVSLPEELPALVALDRRLRASSYVSEVDDWFSAFEVYVAPGQKEKVTLHQMQEALSKLIHSPKGLHFASHFLFQEPLSCDRPVPTFSIFKMDFRYRRLKTQAEKQAAMQEMLQSVGQANLSGYRCVWAREHSQWETDSRLAGELYFNMLVLTVVVVVITVVVVGSGLLALVVVACVMGTLVETMAIMHMWGLSIDVVTILVLGLAVGICVDYQAHMAHAFLVAQGSRQSRASRAIATVALPILHGGISTLITSLALCPSQSHLFLAFNKIFSSITLLGLLHGFVVMPAFLSLLGPNSHTESHPTCSPSTPPTQPDP